MFYSSQEFQHICSLSKPCLQMSAQSSYLVSYCLILLTSVFATSFDVLQNSPIGSRLRITAEILLICAFIRILVVDKFVRPMLEAEPVSWIYATDTRSLVLQSIHTVTIFFACVRIFLRFELSFSSVSFEPTQSNLVLNLPRVSRSFASGPI